MPDSAVDLVLKENVSRGGGCGVKEGKIMTVLFLSVHSKVEPSGAGRGGGEACVEAAFHSQVHYQR